MGRFTGAIRRLGSSHGSDRLPDRGYSGIDFYCSCNSGPVCPSCLTLYHKCLVFKDTYRNSGIARNVIERIEKQMSEFPTVPTYLGKVDYGLLPTPVVNVLEQSGIIGYLTYNDQGEEAFRKLVLACTRACTVDAITIKTDPELFVRSITAGWLRIALSELETNSVASTADEYYKGLFAAKNEPVVNPSVTTTGMRGFQEQPKPEDWDMAIGQVMGFRKWHVMLPTESDPNPILQGSYSKDFLEHEMLEDGRRAAECHNGSRTHPKGQVPADNGCGCGWWAYWSPQEAAKHSSSSDSGRSVAVTVAVEGTGRVVIGQKGFRAQYVKIAGLAPDDAGEMIKLRKLKEFSRMNLLDAPVFRDVETLREEVGCDPNYGTLAARYPELSNHDDRALSVYAWFLENIKRDVENFVVILEERLQGQELAAQYDANDSKQRTYLQVSAELLGSERGIVRQIVTERGSTCEAVCTELLLNETRGEDNPPVP